MSERQLSNEWLIPPEALQFIYSFNYRKMLTEFYSFLTFSLRRLLQFRECKIHIAHLTESH